MISSALLRLLAPILRFIPLPLAMSLYYRVFSSRCHELAEIFDSAPLRFSPQIRMGLKVADAAHGPIAFVGVYERELSCEMWRIARSRGGTLVDVGANYGYFSLLWCAARSDNRAIAVEASPRNLDGLRHNIQSNGFGERITIMPWAASDHEGEVSFDLGPLEQTGWGGITHTPSENTITVPCHRLDHHLERERFSVLKIDCEGADPLVIQGAAELLKSHSIEHVFFEENIGRLEGLGLCAGMAQRLLKQLGYRVQTLGKTGSSEFHAYI